MYSKILFHHEKDEILAFASTWKELEDMLKKKKKPGTERKMPFICTRKIKRSRADSKQRSFEDRMEEGEVRQ